MVALWRCPFGKEPEKMTVDEHRTANEIESRLESGVYTTMQTYAGGRGIEIDSHFDRLEESASLLGGSIQLDRKWIRKIIRIVINENTCKIKIHLPVKPNPDLLYLLVEEVTPPSIWEIENGALILTRRLQRENAVAKSTQFIAIAEQIRQETPKNINEIVMVDEHGFLLEGLSSNFFAVQNNIVRTANNGILRGISRKIVIECLTELAIPFLLEPPHMDEIATFQEAFITSTSRGVLPISAIESINIGEFVPGRVTQMIREEYEKRIRQKLEAI